MDAQSGVKCIVKLMSSESAWKKEVLYHDRTKDNEHVVPMLWAAALQSDSQRDSNALDITKCDYIIRESALACSDTAPYAQRLGRDLMSQFPYAICMPKADSNVSELIVKGVLADMPMGALCFHMRQMAEGLRELHANSRIVHGDVKPRNMVRSGRKRLQLVDFGSALPLGGESVGDAVHIGSARTVPLARLERSSAYLSPEIMACVRNRRDGLGIFNVSDTGREASVDLTSFDLMQAEIWAFGATLYELLAGQPLIAKGVADAASADGEDALVGWRQGGGLSNRYKAPILQRHRCSECPRGASQFQLNQHRMHACSNALELLTRIFHVDQHQRPDSMRDVVQHP